MSFLKKLKFCGRTTFHPMKGFYELKFEKIGSLGPAFVFLILLLVSQILRVTLTGYIFNTNSSFSFNIFMEVGKIVAPIILWTLASWCLTVSFEGEGTIKQVFIATCYATVPLTFVNIVHTILTQVFSLSEAAYLDVFNTIGMVFVGFLILIAMLETHQYTFLRTVISSIVTIIGIVIILFICLLCFNLVQQVFGFFQSIYREIAFRWLS